MPTFLELGIDSEMVKKLNDYRIKEPTPIQVQAIPQLLANKDVIGQAQTGTGKTIAFTLPIIQKINPKDSFVQALIIAPTRELAIQITGEVKKFGAAKGINVLPVYGGQDVDQQIRRLKGAIHIVVGTPGRILDHINRGTVKFGKTSMLVLDEADQMLDMGFLQDIELIIKETSTERQTMLFSATMPSEIQSLATRYMIDPIYIRTLSPTITLEEIRQIAVETTDRRKEAALIELLEEYRPYLAIIFCRTKRRTAALNEALQREGYSSDELHGDVTQARREKVMKEFRTAKIQFLVATDVAARGIDVEGITHIFNFDIPKDAESYIHRIGRTGRAGKSGLAITLFTPNDNYILNLIERGIKIRLEKRKLIPKLNDEHIPNKSVTGTGSYRNFNNTKSTGRAGAHHGGQRRDDRHKPHPVGKKASYGRRAEKQF